MALSRRRLILLCAALLSAALTARLGWWQLDRAAQKVQLQEALQARHAMPTLLARDLATDTSVVAAQLQRSITLDGRWRPEQTVYLDNRPMNGRAGFVAVTPLQLDDGSAVLVQRGWLPRDQADRTRIVAAPAPPGPVQVLGRIAPAPSRLYEFSAAASGAIRQNLDLQDFARETGLRLRPLTVVQEDGAAAPQDGLLRDWPAPAADVHKHYGYAFQWFAMSALIIGLYAWFQILRPRRPSRT
jgi:surfeit locus 1 family protein